MHDSQLNTVTVPAIAAISAPGGAGPTPPALFTASDVPIRLQINNVGGTLIFLAHDQATLSNAPPTSNTYQLKVDKTDVFILAPRQSIYAAALGGGGLVSIAASDALPVS